MGKLKSAIVGMGDSDGGDEGGNNFNRYDTWAGWVAGPLANPQSFSDRVKNAGPNGDRITNDRPTGATELRNHRMAI